MMSGASYVGYLFRISHLNWAKSSGLTFNCVSLDHS